MPAEQLRTADFPEDMRLRFGGAVADARLAAGFGSRAVFARVIGVGKRSIDAIETGEPVVGKKVLKTVGRELGRYLSGWNEDTPRVILTGGPIPPTIPSIVVTRESFDLSDDQEGGEESAGGIHVAGAKVAAGGSSYAAENAVLGQAPPDPSEYADLEGFFRATIRHLIGLGLPRDAILRAAADVAEQEFMRRKSTEGNSPTTSSNGGGTSG